MTGNPTLMDEAAWLRACAAAPEDDLPRLAWADWLDERGEGERAEFVRCQVELAQRGYPGPLTLRAATLEDANPHQPMPGSPAEMAKRCCELLHRLGGVWLGEPFCTLPIGVVREMGWSRGLPDAITLPTVAALVGGRCEACRGITGWYETEDHNQEFRHCAACNSQGRTPGLAATIGRLMGAWGEECFVCRGKGKHVYGYVKCDGRGIHDTRGEQKCLNCHGTGRVWVPGGVLGCVTRVDIADRVPYHYARGGVEDWSWWDEDRMAPVNDGDRSGLPGRIFAIIAQMHPHALQGDNDWLEFPTPDLARTALGQAGALFCRLATREEAVPKPHGWE